MPDHDDWSVVPNGAYPLAEGDLMLRLLRQAEKTEAMARSRGTWEGKPCLILVVVGVNVGLVEQYVAPHGGGLIVTPNEDEEQVP